MAAESTFTASATQENTSVPELKRQAIRDYLTKWLGAKSIGYEKALNNDLVERFILDYRLTKTENNLPIVTGHLDVQAIRSWVKLAEAKQGTQVTRIALLYSENLPSRKIPASETEDWLEKAGAAQSIYRELQQISKSIHGSLSPWRYSTPESAPPKTESGIRALSRAANGNVDVAIWFHQWRCPDCQYGQLEVMVYQLNAGKRIYSRSEEIRATVTQLLPSIRTELDSVMSSDAVRCHAYQLNFADVANYRVFRALDAWISRFDGVPIATLTRVSSHEAQYSVCSSLELDSLAAELIQNHPPGGPTQVVAKGGSEITFHCGN